MNDKHHQDPTVWMKIPLPWVSTSTHNLRTEFIMHIILLVKKTLIYYPYTNQLWILLEIPVEKTITAATTTTIGNLGDS